MTGSQKWASLETGECLDVASPTLTTKLQSVQKPHSKLSRWPKIPNDSNLYNSGTWIILSRASAKSMNVACKIYPSSSASIKPPMSVGMLVAQDIPGRKPCRDGARNVLLFRWERMNSFRILSKILLRLIEGPSTLMVMKVAGHPLCRLTP